MSSSQTSISEASSPQIGANLHLPPPPPPPPLPPPPLRAAKDDVAMDLYVTGFNAWNQLVFEPSTIHSEPDDVFAFTKVLGARKLSTPIARLCYTVVQRDDEICPAGTPPTAAVKLISDGKYLSGHPHAEAANGAILTIEGFEQSREPTTEESLQHLVRYPSLSAWKSRSNGQSWPCRSRIRQIAAYDAGFVALHEDGSVVTLGDPRFEDCLGREITSASPAAEPGHVPEIRNLDEPIKKVVAGGFAVGALTEEGSLYVWGSESPGSISRQQAFLDISGVPNYVEVDGDKDVQDVAFGESHAIALTTDGCVYVIGGNANGQLGIGQDSIGTWTRVNIEAPPGSRIVGVEAGPRSSFILTSRTDVCKLQAAC